MRNKDSFRLLIASIRRSKSLQAIRLTIEMNLHDHTLSEEQRAELQRLQAHYAPQQRKAA